MKYRRKNKSTSSVSHPVTDRFLETFATGGGAAWRIRIVIFFAITLPVVALAVFSYSKAHSDLTEFASLRRQSIANLSAVTLRSQFDQLTKEIENLSQNNVLITHIADEEWEEVSLTLDILQGNTTLYDSVILTDANGIVTTTSPLQDKLIGQNLAPMSWHIAALEANRPIVSNVYNDLGGVNRHMVNISTPLMRQDETLGLITLEIDVENLFLWTRDVDAGQEGIIYFADREGNVAFHPLISPTISTVANYSSVIPVEKALDLERGVQIMFDQRSGVEVLAAYEPVIRYGWAVVVQQPTRAVFSLRQTESQLVIRIYAAILFLNALLAIFLLRSLEVVSTLRLRERALVGSIGEGLIVTDRRGYITRVNRAAAAMLGLTKTFLTGKHIEEVLWVYAENGENLIDHEDRPIIRAMEGNHVTGKYVYMTKGQTRFPVSVTATPLSHSDAINGAVAIFRDITKEEELDRAKKEFISVASHELLTPVSASNAFLSMLISGDFGEISKEQLVYLKKLFALNQRMVELVDDLLNVSRLELGVLESAAEPVDVKEVIESEVHGISPLALTKNIEIRNKLSDDIPTMLLAPKLLRLVLQNLLSNAIKYTPAGGMVTISAEREDSDTFGDSTHIMVSDTGLGIPKDQQAKIFSKFFRAENVREQEIAGTGLGLFIVKNIVRLFKGKIWFESTPGKGTTFHVQIPIKKMTIHGK